MAATAGIILQVSSHEPALAATAALLVQPVKALLGYWKNVTKVVMDSWEGGGCAYRASAALRLPAVKIMQQ